MKTKVRHAKRNSKVSSAAAKRVAVDFPEPLLKSAECAAHELSISRSELIRLAVEHYAKDLYRAKLERELAEGYQANANLDRKIGEEFSAVDYATF